MKRDFSIQTCGGPSEFLTLEDYAGSLKAFMSSEINWVLHLKDRGLKREENSVCAGRLAMILLCAACAPEVEWFTPAPLFIFS